MEQDRPLLGIFLMLMFCAIAPIGDAIAKVLGQTIPISQLVFVRFAVQAAILVPVIWLTGRAWRMTPRVWRLTALRTVLHVFGIWAMVTSLKYLPLADAIAIAFVMPFIMLLLGHYVLGEDIGWRRFGACAVGFGGTLMVIQPSFAEVGWPALLPVVVALNFAFFMLVTRQIAKETDPVALQAVSGVMATVGMAPVFLITHPLGVPGLTMVTPTGMEWTLLLGIGVLGTLAHLLMTWSLRYAPSATLAPMQYLEIPFATLIGWLVFRDLPDGLAAIGIAVIMVAGLYVVWRERITAVTPPTP
ncbi:DMT family transporter [Pseudaestuariivita sp.]|uniref:DMT family transporter n=1 Tax=Pseudaestuariivita sp. TaxID=2211669 RepID=UPI0040583B8E